MKQTIEGKVSKLNYSNPKGTFSAGKIEVKPGTYSGLDLIEDEDLRARVEIEAKKPFARVQSFSLFGQVAQGDTVKLIGEWVLDAKYGPQFKAKGAEFSLPIDEDGLIRYISENPEFKGFGKTGAKTIRLVSHFTKDTGPEGFNAAIASATPEEIATVARVSLEDAENFKKIWSKRSAVNAIASQLAAYELTHSQIEKIIDVFKDSALSVLKANPYALIGQVDGFAFTTTDKIALKTGIKKSDPRRLSAGVFYSVLSQSENGHTWVQRAEVIATANKLLILDDTPEEASRKITAELDALITETQKLYQDLDGRVAIPALFDAEQTIGATLERLGKEQNNYFAGVEPEALPELYRGLNQGQTSAVEEALSRMALAIIGGAGTGKTTIAARIIRAYEKIGRTQISICAPTGKAAKRLEEVLAAANIPRKVQTLHRLLGYDGRGFLVNEIDAQIVIVDEVSMVDSLLFAALCYRLRRGTALLLLGDADQLPPVGAGNPLRDLIAKNICPTAKLTEVVRQAGALRANCLALLQHSIAPQEPKEADGTIPWIICNKISDAENCKEYIKVLFAEHVHRLGFDLLYDVQLLTAQREGPVGVKSLNAALQVIYQAKRGVEIEPEGSLFGSPLNGDDAKAEDSKTKEPRRFFVGDRVIYTRNNYDLNVFNGDVGVIRSIAFKEGKKGEQKFIESISVAFGAKNENDGNLVIIPKKDIGDLSLAYCLTVHKSQGSEYPCVVLIAHKSQAFMHQSQGVNLIYTGATRARKTLILVGDQWGLNNSAAHTATEKRRTWLSLWQPAPNSPLEEEGTHSEGVVDSDQPDTMGEEKEPF